LKPRIYLLIALFIIPFQASLLEPLSVGGIKPDLALVILFIVGLLTGPAEAALFGICLGLIQDIGSAGLLGLSGFTRGLAGLSAGLLGARVLDIGSPAIVVFLSLISLGEGVLISLFLQATTGDVPFFALLAGRHIPQALSTSLLGFVLLRAVNKKGVLAPLLRRRLQKEF
jgi:rod shape-determining protein MreD